MEDIFKFRFLLFLFFLLDCLLYAQVRKDDIKEILMLQNISEEDLDAQTNLLYDQFTEKVSFRLSDLLDGALYSSLSGLSLGAYESNTFGYKNSGWLPKPLHDWYNSRMGYKADYNLLSWQFFFREADAVTDRLAYDKFLRFFKNKWYFAIISHWIVKNTFATMTRDQFRFGKPFYSFQLSLIF